MATRILGPTGSRRRRRFLLVPILLVALAATFAIVGAQASPPEQTGLFELDKNAHNDVTTTLLGNLGNNINATQTSFIVCQASATNPSPLPITIQVDAERMTVGAIASASGGGCSGAFKRTYSSVTRHVGGTTADAHGASGVSGLVTRVVTGTVAGDDWDQVFAAVSANGHPSDADPNPCSGANWSGGSAITACDYIHDNPNESIFTQGGSKDDLDIPNWRQTDGSVPDADDITDGFVAKYVDPVSSHEFLYFGGDRTAVNGAKDMGFWFFKSPVSTNPDGTFSGVHTFGDILLLGTFTNGGAATNIRVFSWVGTGGNTNNTLQSGGTLGDCFPGGQAGGCNTVNNSTITSPWAYQSKISGTPPNTIYAGGFMEGGVDLTTLGLEGCFSSFLAETRSSPEVGAQLKDFLLGTFEVCHSALTTTPADSGGTPLTDTDSNGVPDAQLGTGAAGVDVTDSADLTVSGTSTWSGTLHFFICGPIASGTCDTGGVEIGTGTAVNQGTTMPVVSGTAHLTSVGRYCWRGFFDSNTEGVNDQTDASEGECFEVLPVTPNLTTSAGPDVVLTNPIEDHATLTGTAFQPGDSGDPTYPTINATMVTPADGKITFTLVGPGDCTSTPTGFTPIDVTVSGDSPPTYDASFTPTQVGTFTWIATYAPSVDDVNTLGAGPTACPDTGEEVIVSETHLTTTPADSGGTPLTDSDGDNLPDIQIGTGAAGVDVTDSANLTVSGASTWSGTLHFFICGPIASGTCNTGGLEIGTGTPVDQTTTMPVVSGTANLTSVGRYCWRGFFDSDTVGVGDQTDSSAGECFEVLPVTPTLTTSAGPDVILGNPIEDHAFLTGTAFQPGTDGPNATYPSINATMVTPADGSITFTLLGPDDCLSVPVGFVPIVVTVSGDRSPPGPPSYDAAFTPLQVGTFTWVATYSGDGPNTLSGDPTTCPDTNEAVVVTGTSQLATAQDWLPNDTATITGDTNLNGTLTFQLYTGNNCGATSGAAVVGQDYSFTLTNASSPATRSTTNGSDPANTFKVTDANEGSYSWLVHYDDTTLTDPPDRCETSTVSITD